MFGDRLSAREKSDLIGKTVVFTVIRGGQRVRRQGVITRINDLTIWISAYVYMRGEPRDVTVLGDL